jgi:hypothetical protein
VEWLWAGLFIVGGVAELIALIRRRDEDTLSHFTRSLLVRSKVRWLTLLAWALFSVWFGIHIWF